MLIESQSQLAVPVRGVSGLTDRERALLLADAVDAVAQHDGLSHEAAADLLDRAAETGRAHLAGDDHAVAVTLDGEVVVQVDRDELRALAGVR